MIPAREELNRFITSQLKGQHVIEAVKKIDRKDFVSLDQQTYAYIDAPLSIGYGQTISQPSLVAWMTEQLELTGEEKVLEIGTGSGYQTALLAELAKEVITVERIPELAQQAKNTLDSLNYQNITVITGDGSKGYPAKTPYDAIIVTAAGPNIPQPLIDQLAEGGRLVMPVGGPWVQEVIKGVKKKGKLETKRLLPVRFVPLIEE